MTIAQPITIDVVAGATAVLGDAAPLITVTRHEWHRALERRTSRH